MIDDEFRQPLEIILNSKRGVKIGELDGFKYFILDDEIQARPDEKIMIHLKKAFLPFSFYCISSSQFNNILDVKETQIDGTNNSYSITLTDGNYNITQLISTIKDGLEYNSTFNYKYDILYSSITNKLDFIILSGTEALKTEFLFNSGGNAFSSICRVLGFTKEDKNFTLTTKLTSNLVCDLSDGLDAIHIKTNLSTDNIRSVKGSQGNELLIIPIMLAPNSIIYFDEGNNPFKHKLATNNIKRVDIKFTDNNDNIVHFNEINWTLILIVEFVRSSKLRVTSKNKYLEEKEDKINKINQNKKLMSLVLDKNKKNII